MCNSYEYTARNTEHGKQMTVKNTVTNTEHGNAARNTVKNTDDSYDSKENSSSGIYRKSFDDRGRDG